MKAAFVDKAVALNDIADHYISITDMEQAFEKGFKQGLGIELKPLTLTDEQLQEVKNWKINIVQMNGIIENNHFFNKTGSGTV